MKSPCRRICKLDDQQICIGCGRTWLEIKEWITYSDEQRQNVIDKLKDFKSNIKSKFE
jgi:predicted Fe-S protein YdhL (DUF1289 family)